MRKGKLSLRKKRIDREIKTVETMIHMYCKAKHGSKDKLCESCSQLLEYAVLQYEKCPFGEIKPECLVCPIHCYKPDKKSEIKNVMRYSGPRMIYKHPVMAIEHLIAKWKYSPEKALERMEEDSTHTKGFTR
ncbi:MAG: nitrous oxide-stimulated promoter family protein [Bacteroidales bacterium]|nr:nitrous oxide-stimulated promoter family protein [Bacteroidales bacterium]